jgi:hypothetical protein
MFETAWVLGQAFIFAGGVIALLAMIDTVREIAR